VDNYPWGFHLRTKVRYWVETNDKKSGGERFCKQTLNPKTGLWCKPKKSTYDLVGFMYLDEKGHVQYEALNIYTADNKAIDDFVITHKDNLNDYQIKTLKLFKARNEVMKKVTWTIEESKPIDLSTVTKEEMTSLVEEQEKNQMEQIAIKKKLTRFIYAKSKTIEL